MKAYCIDILILLVGLLLFIPWAHGAHISLQIEGLNGYLQSNVKAQLSTVVNNDESTTDASKFQIQVNNAIREGLRAIGYYSPTISFKFYDNVHDDSHMLIAKVNPGKPIKVAEINIMIHGDALYDKEYQKLVKCSKLFLGSVLNHSDYDKFKIRFSQLALSKGYFDANFRKHQLIIVPKTNKSYWNIDFDSGRRYRFGKIRFHDLQIQEDYLQNISPIHEDDLYNSDSIAEMNRLLASTNWFDSIIISPDFKSAKDSKIISLDAMLQPSTRNNIETGIGYASDIGIRVKTTWNNPWINSFGHSLNSSLSISALEKMLFLSYKIPLLKSPIEQYYLIKYSFKREYLNDNKLEASMLNVTRYWDLSRGWQQALSLSWNPNYFTQDRLTSATMLIYLTATTNRTCQSSGFMPEWGNSQRYSIDISNNAWGSAANFVMIQTQHVWISTLAYKHRFIVRGNLGWIETNTIKYIPQTMRLFAGGDRSIRGYKYRSIAPTNLDGKLIGATRLIIGSLEYQYNLIGKWWSALFLDSGEAVNYINQDDFKTGVGIGMRWQSPLGPVKMDISVSLNNYYDNSLHVYIGFGPEL